MRDPGIWFWLLIMFLLMLAGCSSMRVTSSQDHGCAEVDGCWTQQKTPLGWAWCRKENSVDKCIMMR